MAWRDFYDYIAEKLEAARKFIDVEGDDDSAHSAAVDVARQIEQSRAERFLQKIAQAVDAILQEEIIRTPTGKAFFPEKYIVFLNPDDARDWTGKKLDFVRHELSHIILNEARKHAAAYEVVTEQVEIDFRIDGTLEQRLLRVQAIYDDNQELTVVADGEKTFVTGLNRAARIVAEEVFEQEPSEPLFSVEVWRDERHEATIPIYKREAVIGRGTAHTPADVQLRDAAVSRRHAVIELEPNGAFAITHFGANPTLLNGETLESKQKTELPAAAKIEISDFTVSINANIATP